MKKSQLMGVALAAALGVCSVMPSTAFAYQKDEPGTWVKQEDGRYRYVYDDGTWATAGKGLGIEEFYPDGSDGPSYWIDYEGYWLNGWYDLGGTLDGGPWLYFTADGPVQKGWYKVDGAWYHFYDGFMEYDTLVHDSGKTYYVDKSGAMRTGWRQVKSGWYWFDGSGTAATGWKKIGGSWYWFDGNGVMATGWQRVGGSWYYLGGSGAMATGWRNVGGTWYWLDASGAMATGWEKIGGVWYYFNASGAMLTGWQQVDGEWYFLDASEAMTHDRWQGNYYLTSPGAMATNSWIGSYWVGANGCWIPGASRYDTSAHQHSWATRTVTDSAAWDERVLVRAAYDEGVYDGEEIVFSDGHVCQTAKEAADYSNSQLDLGNNVSYSVRRKTRIVHHDAEYKTVHHDAVTHTETYCTTCGVIW